MGLVTRPKGPNSSEDSTAQGTRKQVRAWRPERLLSASEGCQIPFWGSGNLQPVIPQVYWVLFLSGWHFTPQRCLVCHLQNWKHQTTRLFWSIYKTYSESFLGISSKRTLTVCPLLLVKCLLILTSLCSSISCFWKNILGSIQDLSNMSLHVFPCSSTWTPSSSMSYLYKTSHGHLPQYYFILPWHQNSNDSCFRRV